jgi:hypothetical protein
MAENEIHVGDVGTTIEVTLTEDGSVIDISTATSQEIKIKGPKGNAVKSITSTFVTNGTDGKIEFVSSVGDFDKEGVWRIQAKVTLTSPAGTWSSDYGEFTVFPNL